MIQGIVPNAELAHASAPFAVVYAQMFAPWVGNVIIALAVVACIGSLVGWQFTLAQTAKMSADQRMFPRFFSRITQANAPLLGLLACAALQSLIALSTISTTASAQFSKLVSLAVVTNLAPYVTALTGLMVMMHKEAVQVRNTLAVLVATAYSLYAIHACGAEAVFGAMLVLAFGYVLYGFLAKRFVGDGRAESC
ncbi:amino acid transporter [Pseudomonas rhodesiae]|nr:amino acid transporter [Pseudomonas rhodesiae]MDF9770355.1 amino acid transporter [Pseudomonas rhodesiae]